MSVGDGREGKVRAALHGKGQLGGKLAGLSLPRQIVHIALWPLLEQVMSFICASTSLFLATHMGTEGSVTEQIASGIGVTGYVMWLGFLMQGAVGMGATAIVSRMTGARKFGEANYAANQAAMLGLLAGGGAGPALGLFPGVLMPSRPVHFVPVTPGAQGSAPRGCTCQ